jgi:hypothetical protein
MKTLQFEGVKVALKQDKTGYVLTLSLHPDDIPEDLLRDFVGSRYQVVMVRIGDNEQPMDPEEFAGNRAVRVAAMLCKDPKFWKYLHEDLKIYDEDEEEATNFIRQYLNIPSRSELKSNKAAQILLDKLHKEYQAWTQN